MKAIKSIGKGMWSLVNLFYKGMGIIIGLIILVACPPLGIIVLGGLLYYIYKCCKKKG